MVGERKSVIIKGNHVRERRGGRSHRETMQGGHVRMRGGKREKWALGSAQIIASISLSGRNGCDGGMGREGRTPSSFSIPIASSAFPSLPRSPTDRPGRTEIKEKRAPVSRKREIDFFKKNLKEMTEKEGKHVCFSQK